jgi:hypothetical protein
MAEQYDEEEEFDRMIQLEEDVKAERALEEYDSSAGGNHDADAEGDPCDEYDSSAGGNRDPYDEFDELIQMEESRRPPPAEAAMHEGDGEGISIGQRDQLAALMHNDWKLVRMNLHTTGKYSGVQEFGMDRVHSSEELFEAVRNLRICGSDVQAAFGDTGCSKLAAVILRHPIPDSAPSLGPRGINWKQAIVLGDETNDCWQDVEVNLRELLRATGHRDEAAGVFQMHTDEYEFYNAVCHAEIDRAIVHRALCDSGYPELVQSVLLLDGAESARSAEMIGAAAVSTPSRAPAARDDGESEQKRRRMDPGDAISPVVAPRPPASGISKDEAARLSKAVGADWDAVRWRLHEILEFNKHPAASRFGRTMEADMFWLAHNTEVPPWMIAQALDAAGCGGSAGIIREAVVRAPDPDWYSGASHAAARAALQAPPVPIPDIAPADLLYRGIGSADRDRLVVALRDGWQAVREKLHEALASSGNPDAQFYTQSEVRSADQLFLVAFVRDTDRSFIRQALIDAGHPELSTLTPVPRIGALCGVQEDRPVPTTAPEPAPPASGPAYRGINEVQRDRLAVALRDDWRTLRKKLHEALNLSGNPNAYYFAEGAVGDADRLCSLMFNTEIDVPTVRRALADAGHAELVPLDWPLPPPPAPGPLDRGITWEQAHAAMCAVGEDWNHVWEVLHAGLEEGNHPAADRFGRFVHMSRADTLFHLIVDAGISSRLVGWALRCVGHEAAADVLARGVSPPSPPPTSGVPKFEDVEAAKGGVSCSVCMVNKPQLAPACGHLCLCGACARIIAGKSGAEGFRCPICNTATGGKLMRIFF